LLGRSLEGSGGLCRGRSTAAARWRPSGRFWALRGGVARGGGASARQQAGEELVRDAWAPAHGGVMAGKAGKASAAALSVASAARSRAGRWEMVIRVDL